MMLAHIRLRDIEATTGTDDQGDFVDLQIPFQPIDRKVFDNLKEAAGLSQFQMEEVASKVHDFSLFNTLLAHRED